MMRDPNEPAASRLPAFRKSEEVDDYLQALNKALLTSGLPVPVAHGDPESLPVIYIVGAPRSGTTLLSQLLSRYLPVGYINNLVARLWLRPSVGIMLSKAMGGEDFRRQVTFSSIHGTTEGMANPHEFGYFWRHWLRLDQSSCHNPPDSDKALINKEGLKKALENEILSAFGTPVIFKNVICGFYASILSQLHAKSFFIYIERDIKTVIRSVLKTRKERYGSYETWWSVKPSTYQIVIGRKTSPVEEVARQILDCRREMKEELSRPGVRWMHVSYEDLCDDPTKVTGLICAKLAESGIDIKPDFFDTPAFKRRDGAPLNAEYEQMLTRFFVELEHSE
jgi:hypothetical protein